jgi:hypothetical protein
VANERVISNILPVHVSQTQHYPLLQP